MKKGKPVEKVRKIEVVSLMENEEKTFTMPEEKTVVIEVVRE